MYLNIPRQEKKRSVITSLGISYGLTEDALPFEYFSCQTLSEQEAGEEYMRSSMQRAVNKLKS